jgi:hypothetical protein
MKTYKPPQRLVALGLVLQYDSELQKNGRLGIFSTFQRILINQERAKILSEDDTYRQAFGIENKIEFVLEKIKATNFQPEKPICYE